MIRSRRWIASALCAGLILCLASCSEGRLPTHPVSGRLVDQKGNGVAGAELNFYTDDGIASGKVFPQAITGPDGSFQVRTYEDGDGAPPGTYKVTVFLNQAAPEGVDPDEYSQSVKVHPYYEKFERRDTTPLVATVSEQTSQLDPLVLQ